MYCRQYAPRTSLSIRFVDLCACLVCVLCVADPADDMQSSCARPIESKRMPLRHPHPSACPPLPQTSHMCMHARTHTHTHAHHLNLILPCIHCRYLVETNGPHSMMHMSTTYAPSWTRSPSSAFLLPSPSQKCSPTQVRCLQVTLLRDCVTKLANDTVHEQVAP